MLLKNVKILTCFLSFYLPFKVEATILVDSCDVSLKVYSGITANYDGLNDEWIIEGIEKCLDNYVALYNRWGELVWEGIGYDNKTIVWKGDNFRKEPLPVGTYYYTIKRKNKINKGWVYIKS